MHRLAIYEMGIAHTHKGQGLVNYFRSALHDLTSMKLLSPPLVNSITTPDSSSVSTVPHPGHYIFLTVAPPPGHSSVSCSMSVASPTIAHPFTLSKIVI